MRLDKVVMAAYLRDATCVALVGCLCMSRAVVEHWHAKLMQRIVATSSQPLTTDPPGMRFLSDSMRKMLPVTKRLKFAKDSLLITCARSKATKLPDILTVFPRVCRQVIPLPSEQAICRCTPVGESYMMHSPQPAIDQ